jgi:acetoin utilization protein AcuB
VTPRVADVLTGAPLVVAPDDSLARARARMRAHGTAQAAVVVGGRLVGLVTSVDLDAAHPSAATTLTVQEIGGALQALPVRSVMREVPAVGLRTPLAEAARLMRDGERSALPVIRGDAVVGVLTDLDVLAWMAAEAPAARFSATA